MINPEHKPWPFAPRGILEKLSQGRDVVLAAIGDSLTYGWMVDQGYLDFLRQTLRSRYPASRLTVINRGIPGDTADNGLRRIRRDVLDLSPDGVLVQYALNDAFMGYTPQSFRRSLEGMIEEIQADGDAEIVLVTSVYLEEPREYERALLFYGEMEGLARKYRLPLARVHSHWEQRILSGTDFGRLVQGDLVHPTEEGYRLMAEAVAAVFLP